MDVQKVLVELRAYKAQLDETIGVLDRLAHQRGEKRGRPLQMPPVLERGVAARKRKRTVVRRKRATAAGA
jgi:hypothetical protein